MDFNPVYIDDLTGVLNRRYLYERLRDEVDSAVRSGHGLWFAMIDIDKFKSINDTYGHLQGDHILREVSSVFRREVRASDKVIRFGGDEFILLLIDGGLVSALNIINRIKERLASCKFSTGISGLTIDITISVGLAGYPDDTNDHEKLISLADEALYVAKSKGRSCIALVSDISPDTIINRDVLERFPAKEVVGREEEKKLFKDFLSSNNEKVMLLSGPIGVGKSKLLEYAEKTAFMYGYLPFYLQSTAVRGPALYVMWRYFEDNYLDVYPDIYMMLTEEELQTLSSFKNIYMESEVMGKIIPVLKSIFKKINEYHSIVFVLDDLHRLDEDSFWYIVQLLSSSANPVKVLGAYDDMNKLKVANFIDILLDRTLGRQISVLLADKEWIADYLKFVFGNIELKTKQLHLMYLISKGNAMYLEEFLKLLMIEKYIIKEGTKWVIKEIPEKFISYTLRDIVVDRISDLDEDIVQELFSIVSKGHSVDSIWQSDIGIVKKGYLLDIIKSWQRVLISEVGSEDSPEISVNGMLQDIVNILEKKSDKSVVYKENIVVDISLLRQFVDIVSLKLYAVRKTGLSQPQLHLVEVMSQRINGFVKEFPSLEGHKQAQDALSNVAKDIKKIIHTLIEPFGFLYFRIKTDDRLEINFTEYGSEQIYPLINAMLESKIESIYIDPPVSQSDLEALLVLMVSGSANAERFLFRSEHLILNQVILPVIQSFIADIQAYIEGKDYSAIPDDVKKKVFSLTMFLLRILINEEYEDREHILASLNLLYKSSPDLVDFMFLSFAKYRNLLKEGGVKVLINFLDVDVLGKSINRIYNQGLISGGFIVTVLDIFDSQSKRDGFLTHVNELIFSQKILRENVLNNIDDDAKSDSISNSIAALSCMDKWELIMNNDGGESVFSLCIKLDKKNFLSAFVDYLGISLNNSNVVFVSSEYIKDLARLLIETSDKDLIHKFTNYFISSIHINNDDFFVDAFVDTAKDLAKAMLSAQITDSVLIFLSELSEKSERIYEQVIKDPLINFYSYYLLDEFFSSVLERKPIQNVLKAIILSGESVLYRLTKEVVYADRASSIGYFDSFLMRRIVAEQIPPHMRASIISWLSQFLVNKKWFVVRNTLEMLSYIIDESEINILRPALNSGDERVINRLIFVLNKIGGYYAWKMLAEIYHMDISKHLKDRILKLMKKIKDKKVLNHIKLAMR